MTSAMIRINEMELDINPNAGKNIFLHISKNSLFAFDLIVGK